ncbi:hypothetical protein [Actinocrispum sp. NPDC049592]|uniref:hypothetical protein n=1 Tax=Actinocrispum sp. NPDC049592 TaxID=3154835 RepID=UPI003442729D
MRQAYAHDAVVLMEPDADIREPGGAVTVALCGELEHAPPCPLAAHHTAAHRDGGPVRLRILFATEPSSESVVRQRIDSALRARWEVVSSSAGEVSGAEWDHAARLTR